MSRVYFTVKPSHPPCVHCERRSVPTVYFTVKPSHPPCGHCERRSGTVLFSVKPEVRYFRTFKPSHPSCGHCERRSAPGGVVHRTVYFTVKPSHHLCYPYERRSVAMVYFTGRCISPSSHPISPAVIARGVLRQRFNSPDGVLHRAVYFTAKPSHPPAVIARGVLRLAV